MLVINVPSAFLHPRAVCINQFLDDKLLPKARKLALHCLADICSFFADDEGWAANVVPIIEEVPARTDRRDGGPPGPRPRRRAGEGKEEKQDRMDTARDDGRPRIVAHRIWFFIKNEFDWAPGDEFEGLMRENGRRENERRRAYFKTPRRVDENAKQYLWHELLSRDDYLTMCSRVVPGKNYNNVEECRRLPLRSSLNIANPFFVFDIWNAMRGIPEADPRFTNWKNYFHYQGATHVVVCLTPLVARATRAQISFSGSTPLLPSDTDPGSPAQSLSLLSTQRPGIGNQGRS